MKIHVARQPIFDKNKNVYAYELLFRSGTENVFSEIDGDSATSQLLSNSFMSFDIDQLSNSKPVFINFTRELLLKRIPELFPRTKVTIEVLENIAPEDDIIDALKELSAQGYSIALDDFEYSEIMYKFIDLCNIVKIDFRITSLEDMETVLSHFPPHVRFLAEKVETYDEYTRALEMGFELFQGYFFARPEMLKHSDIEPSKLVLLQILSAIYEEEYDIGKIENLMNMDVALTYKLLRYINSAFFAHPVEIKSIRHAVTYIGIHEIRRFISLLCAGTMSENKPGELFLSCAVRAKFAELIVESEKLSISKDNAFLSGLFSLIDAMLDCEMSDVLQKLPLTASVKNALLEQSGVEGEIIKLVSAYERGFWDTGAKLAEELNIPFNSLPGLYMKSLEWSEKISIIN